MKINPCTSSALVRALAWMAVAAFLNPAAPVSAQLFGGDDVARKQIAEQSKRLEALRLQNEELSARLGRMEESLQGLSASNPALELAQQLERLRQEMMQLRGQLEVVGNDIQMAAKRQRDMYVDLDTRMKRVEQSAAEGAAAAASPPSAGGTAAPAAAAAAGAASDMEARAYEAAQAQRKSGNYQGAIAGFRNFLAQYPKSPLAHRAQYWIGDSYFNLRDYKNAIASQRRLISTFPESASVPDALLNIASSQVELGDAAGARRTLDKLVGRYPTSEAAEKARRRLATLK
ncbi:MAG TPA: tol-pal system protein YbgF [Burkholderiales bacterium]|nr:tol-pal system protein YbgF [Burkholderiales bacterium]